MVYLGKRCCISKKKIAPCDWKNSKVWPTLSGEMRLEKENSDTVKVHFAKIIEKQKNNLDI